MRPRQSRFSGSFNPHDEHSSQLEPTTTGTWLPLDLAVRNKVPVENCSYLLHLDSFQGNPLHWYHNDKKREKETQRLSDALFCFTAHPVCNSIASTRHHQLLVGQTLSRRISVALDGLYAPDIRPFCMSRENLREQGWSGSLPSHALLVPKEEQLFRW